MPKTRIQKEETVNELTTKLATAKSVVMANFQGLTMAQLSELRQKLEDVSAELAVTKNNLIKISLKESGHEVDDVMLFGPTATLINNDDEIAGIKVLTKHFKDWQVGSIKGGYLAKSLMSADQINKLANLPTKDQLRGQVVGALGAPLYGIVGVLQANIRNLVSCLDQIRISKGGE